MVPLLNIKRRKWEADVGDDGPRIFNVSNTSCTPLRLCPSSFKLSFALFGFVFFGFAHQHPDHDVSKCCCVVVEAENQRG